jgi:hypothetical protein
MRMLLRRPRTTAIAVPAVLLLLTVGPPALVRAQEPDEAIHACYHLRSGDLRIVESEADCRPPERPLSWNVPGPGGPSGSVAARIRDQGPVSLGLRETLELPLTGNTWTQAAGEFQDLVGQIEIETTCPGFATAVIPVIRVFLDGEERATLPVTERTSEFRFPSFEPPTETTHTLTVTITERDCRPPHVVRSVKFDVLRYRTLPD